MDFARFFAVDHPLCDVGMKNILIGAQVFCWQKFVIQLVPKTPKIYGIKALEKKAQKQPPFKGIIAIKPD